MAQQPGESEFQARLRNGRMVPQAQNLTNQQLWESGYRYDVIVKAGDKEWKLHRIVIRESEAYYFKEKLGSRSYDDDNRLVIELEVVSTRLLNKVLKFIYIPRIGVDSDKDRRGKDLVDLAHIYNMAHQFEMEKLKVAVISEYKRTTAALQKGSVPGGWDVPQLLEAHVVVYAITPEKDKGLRDVFCDFLAPHLNLLMEDKHNLYQKMMKAGLVRGHDYPLDHLRAGGKWLKKKHG